MMDNTAKAIPAFTRDDFPSYFKMIKSSCSTSKGAVAMVADADPITVHVQDPFISALIGEMSNKNRRAFRDSMSSATQIKAKPKLVFEALKIVFENKLVIHAEGSEYLTAIRPAYMELKSACETWVQSESTILRICCSSLQAGDMLQLANDSLMQDFAGRALLDIIEKEGANYSDKAAAELVTSLVTNKKFATESVLQYHRRHTGILKQLKKRGLSSDEILNLIEKTRFVDGLPDETYGLMKSVVAFNKGYSLDDILRQGA